jgi:hypothetical protein
MVSSLALDTSRAFPPSLKGKDKFEFQRSLLPESWLLIPAMHIRPSVHPLLLDPIYWRNCLLNLDLGLRELVFQERRDLSTRRAKVAEFLLCSHDGTPLRGLCSRPAWVPGRRPFRVRSVGSSGQLEMDKATLKQGVADFVFRGPDDRPLKDRVLDVVAVVHMAKQVRGIDAKRTNLGDHDVNRADDEFMIAEHLLAWDLFTTLP